MNWFADKALMGTIAVVIVLAGLVAILLFIISPFAWWPLPAAILTAVIIASAAGVHYTPQAVYYSGALVAMAPEAVLVAALSTALSYMGDLYPASMPFTPSVFAVFIGLAIGLVFWLLSAVVYCYFHLSAVDGANSRTYGQLVERLADLDNRLQVLCRANSELANTAAANEAKSLSNKVRNSLYPRGPKAQELQGISKCSVPTDPATGANMPGGLVAAKGGGNPKKLSEKG